MGSNSAATFESRIASLTEEIDALHNEFAHDEASRKQLLEVIMRGLAKVESPSETIWRMMMWVC
jgi:hypothetical protein